MSALAFLRRWTLPVGLALLVGCQSSQKSATKGTTPPPPAKTANVSTGSETRSPGQLPPASPMVPLEGAPVPATNTMGMPARAQPNRTTLSQTHNAELQAILDLAKKGQWDAAEVQASMLYEMDPQDPPVQRVYNWVTKQRQMLREQTLEDKIREIDANNSAFNPTLQSLFGDSKDRGLPPRKDVRDAIGQFEATPYIPETYGKTIHRRGLLFDLDTEEGRMAKILDKEITVHLDNTSLESIIFTIGQAEGINFVADRNLPAFKQVLSVNLDKVQLKEFLNYISRNLDVQFQIGSDLIWIVDAKDPKRVQEETRFFRLRKGFVMPAKFGATDTTVRKIVNPANPGQVTAIEEVTRVNNFVADGAPAAPSLENAITNFFTGSKWYIDYERNLIVARGTREQLDILDKIVKEFDRSMQQVLIEARFITVSQPAFLQLGVLWETDRSFVPRGPQDFTGLVNPDYVSQVGRGIQQTMTNVFGVSTLSATLSALEQSGESQTLSAPRLTVINNRPATISDGKVQYYYEEYGVLTTLTQYTASQSFVPQGKPTKLTAGVDLDVMASIGGDGQSILLALHPKVSADVQLVTFATLTTVDSGGHVTSTFDIKLPEYRTQDISTRVTVRSGQTVVMGGVMQREQSTYVESVPILGNIPLIGALFRRRTELDRPRYLLIFVTATLLSDSGEFVIYDEDPAK